MFLRYKKLELPTPDEALQGRPIEMPVADTHTVLGTPLKGPWPTGDSAPGSLLLRFLVKDSRSR